MKKLCFNQSVASDINLVKLFLRDALEILHEYNLDEEQSVDVKLILNELVLNGVIHGNKGDVSKKVNLKIFSDQGELIFIVKDEGCGCKFSFDSYNYEEKLCTGRGLVLVRALTDDLILNDNEIIAVKSLK